MLAPLRRTTHAVARMGRDEATLAMLPVRRPDEVGELVEGFNSLVHTIEERTARLEKTHRELEASLAEVEQLSGLLPICSYCRKIRDDQGYWGRLEEYLSARSEVSFSHGICEDCAREHFPGLLDEE